MPRFLIIQLARFGDIVQTGRLVASLPGEVHLCTDTSLAPLARLIYPHVVVHGLPAHAAGLPDDSALLAALHPALTELAALSFDAVYNLNHSPLNRALGRLFPAAIQRGHCMDNGQHLLDAWVRYAFRWTTSRRAAPLNLADFWAHLAPAPVAGDQVHPVARPGGRGLGVVLAGRHARRSLPPEQLAPLVQALFERHGGPAVYFFGTRQERSAGRALAALLPAVMQGHLHNLAGRTSFAELVEALTGLDALLTPDTGTMHLAARLGVPLEALFLSSAWAFETGPYGMGHRIWQAAPPCGPCLESARCEAIPCLAPFQSRWLIRTLAGHDLHSPPPENLVPLRTDFDELGLVLRPISPVEAPDEAARAPLRRLLAIHRGLPGADHDPSLQRMADTFYQEADWMLPQARS